VYLKKLLKIVIDSLFVWLVASAGADLFREKILLAIAGLF
jgi:hypothetical protein